MWIILRVTGSAIGRRREEVRRAACIKVALIAGNLAMPAGQLERDLTVVKVVAVLVNPIVTGQAVIPIIL